jgi:hypothetical protein
MTKSHFFTSKQFAKEWSKDNVKTIEQLLDGAEKRQDKLIGLTIDAAIVTYVVHALADGERLTNMKSVFRMSAPDRHEESYISSHDSHIRIPVKDVQGTIDSMRSIPNEQQKLSAIRNYVLHALAGPGLIINHREMVQDDAWDVYKKNRLEWTALKPYLDKIGENSSIKEPHDPRLELCNTWTSKWLRLKDSGPKSADGVHSKIARKAGKGRENFNPSVEIRDINRIMILPAVPEVADTFYQVLDEQIRRRVAHLGDEKPHIFIENWTVKPWGQFDRMAYIALHNENEQAQLIKNDVCIAEIKAVGRAMERADQLTGPIYQLQRELDDIAKYFPSTNKKPKEKEGRPEYLDKRKALSSAYESKKILYESLWKIFSPERLGRKGELPEGFQFPPLLRDFDHPTYYETLREGLVRLNQRINIDALSQEKESGPWKRKFVKTAYYQQEARETQQTGRSQKLAIQEQKVTVDRFENGLMKQIKGLTDKDHEELNLAARQEWREVQGKGFLNPKPRSGSGSARGRAGGTVMPDIGN